jgi:hypothetical protein
VPEAIECSSFEGRIIQHSGLAVDLPVTISGIMVYLQMWVVENLGTEVVLGGPFKEVVQLGEKTSDFARPMYKLSDPSLGQRMIVVGMSRKPMGF